MLTINQLCSQKGNNWPAYILLKKGQKSSEIMKELTDAGFHCSEYGDDQILYDKEKHEALIRHIKPRPLRKITWR